MGLANPASALQWVVSAAGILPSWWARRTRGDWDPGAPIADPPASYTDLRHVARRLLPGATVRQRLYWRHSLVWRAPAEA